MASPLGKAKSLKFKKDGTFRIMQIADTQDTNITSRNTVEFIGKALDSENPDLVVFTGACVFNELPCKRYFGIILH